MAPLVRYLTTRGLPEDKNEARRVKYLAGRFLMINGRMYKRGYAQPYLRCLDEGEASYVLREIHERICETTSADARLHRKHFGKDIIGP